MHIPYIHVIMHYVFSNIYKIIYLYIVIGNIQFLMVPLKLFFTRDLCRHFNNKDNKGNNF